MSCFHGDGTTLRCVVLTDSCTRPVGDEVSLKKRHFLPPSYFLGNANWSVTICCHYFSSSCNQWINQTRPHIRAACSSGLCSVCCARCVVLGVLCSVCCARCVVLGVHLGVLVVSSIAKCAMPPPLKHSFRLSVGGPPPTEHSDGPSAPYWWAHCEFRLWGKVHNQKKLKTLFCNLKLSKEANRQMWEAACLSFCLKKKT